MTVSQVESEIYMYIGNKYKPLKFTLVKLFGDIQMWAWRSRRVINVEVELIEALANADEYAIPDDGAIEIDDDEVYQG